MFRAPPRPVSAESPFASVHNVYERLVVEQIRQTLGFNSSENDSDYLADVACVALNHLPPRYLRYEVDFLFYLSPQERAELEQKVAQAVNQAVLHVANSRRSASGGYQQALG